MLRLLSKQVITYSCILYNKTTTTLVCGFACDVFEFLTTGNDKESSIKIMNAYTGHEEPEEPLQSGYKKPEQPAGARRKKKTKRTASKSIMQNEMVADDDIEVPPLPPPLSLPCLVVNYHPYHLHSHCLVWWSTGRHLWILTEQ